MLHQIRKFDLQPVSPSNHVSSPYNEHGVQSFAGVVSRIGFILQIPKASNKDATEQYLDLINLLSYDSVTSLAETCFNQSTLFSSVAILVHCVTLATAAVSSQNDTRILEFSRTEYASQELGRLGISDLANFDGARVLQNLVSCAIGGCQDASAGNCSQSTLALGKVDITPETLEYIHDGLIHYCDDIALDFNADIAGPGV